MRPLSIVVPVYNKEPNVDPCYQAVNPTLRAIADRYRCECVFTDNCSTDRTFEHLEVLAARDSQVRTYSLTRNFGFKRPILTGYRLARGEAAVQIGCDLQDAPELILDFVKHWEAGYRIVFGACRCRDDPARMQAARRLFYRLIDRLISDELPLDAGDFRLIDGDVLDLLHGCSDQSRYPTSYTASLGYRQLGVPYNRTQRRGGRSAFGCEALVNPALDGIVGRSILPLRLASFVGVLLSGLALLGIGTYAAMWFTGPRDWPAGFATLATLLPTSIALKAIFVGIFGEHLAGIDRQVQPGLVTIVERFIDRTESAAIGAAARPRRMVAGIVLPNVQIERGPGRKGAGDGV